MSLLRLREACRHHCENWGMGMGGGGGGGHNRETVAGADTLLNSAWRPIGDTIFMKNILTLIRNRINMHLSRKMCQGNHRLSGISYFSTIVASEETDQRAPLSISDKRFRVPCSRLRNAERNRWITIRFSRCDGRPSGRGDCAMASLSDQGADLSHTISLCSKLQYLGARNGTEYVKGLQHVENRETACAPKRETVCAPKRNYLNRSNIGYWRGTT